MSADVPVVPRSTEDEEEAASVRLKAASELVRHSGMSLEKQADRTVTVNLGGADATELVATRLDRLAAAMQPDVIAGELAPENPV